MPFALCFETDRPNGFFRFLMLAVLFALVGCGKKVAEVKVAVDPNEGKDLPQKPGPKAHGVPEQITFKPTDLRRFGIVGAIDLPDGATMADDADKVNVTLDRWFQLTISKPTRSLAEEKAELVKQYPSCTWLSDEPDAFIAESSKLPAGRLVARAKLDGREYQFTNDGMTERVTKEALLRMLACARSLRLTEDVKQAVDREKESLAKLKKLGYLCEKFGKGWEIESVSVDEKSLNLLKDLSWVRSIAIRNAKITLPAMRAIAEIPQVEFLRLDQDITDELLAPVGKMSSLKSLSVRSTDLTDAGLEQLAPLVKLKSLRLIPGKTKIVGPGLACVQGMTELENLDVLGVPLGDEALSHIGKCTKLKALHLGFTRITDKGLGALKDLTELQRLNLVATSITNRAFLPLSRLTGLKQLSLSRTAITGQGLKYFRSAGVRLENLNVSTTFLNNEGLKELKGQSLKELNAAQTSITADGLMGLADHRALEKLDLANNALTDAGLTHLSKLAKLQELKLTGTAINGSELAQLKNCAELATLSLLDTPLTDEGLAKLPLLPKLWRLNVVSTHVSDQGLIKKLADLPDLSMIDAWNTRVTKQGVDQIRAQRPNIEVDVARGLPPVVPPIALKDLKPADPLGLCKKLGVEPEIEADSPGKPIVGLNFANQKITDINLAELRELNQLKKLDLQGCKELTQAGFSYLSGLTQLEELNLGGTFIRGDGLVFLKNCTKLRRLTLSEAELSLEQLQPLAACKNLQQLEVNLQGNLAATWLSNFAELEELFIRTNDDRRIVPNGQGLMHLQGLRNLKKLHVALPALSDSAFVFIAGIPALERLHLENCRISDAGLSEIKSMKKLMELRLPARWITDDGILQLRDVDHLAKLYLSDSVIGDRGLQYIGEMRDLDTLIIPGCKITDEGLKALRDREELRTLDFSHTAVTGKGFAALRESKIAHVDLSDSKVNDAGMTGIYQLKHLQTLRLNQNDVTDAGLAKLKKHPALTTLDLDGNVKLTDAGLTSLGMIPNLESVSLRHTSVTEKGIADFQKTKPDLKIRFKD